MARVLIAGCGDIGCQLGQKLAKLGHQVSALRRNIQKVPAGIDAIKHDLTQPFPELSLPFDYVFYTAAAGKYKDSAYYQAYVHGLKNLLNALKLAPPKRIFFTSSTSVFGQSDGEWVTEDAPTSDSSFSTHRLLQGEHLLLESGLPVTIVRFGGIYGPGRTHLIDLVRAGKAHCMEGVYSNRIHSADAVGILQHLMSLLEQGNSIDSLYIAVDNTPVPTCEVYDWLAKQLRVKVLEHQEPTETSRQLRSNKRLSNAKIRSTGYQFQYPSYQAGYRELIQQMQTLATETDGKEPIPPQT